MENKKIILVDIDGCMNDYPIKYVEFVNSILGTDYKYSHEVKNGLQKEDFLEFKRLYFMLHQNNADSKYGLQDAMLKLMDKYTVYILTSRAPNCKLITYKWLAINNIVYNECFFQHNKGEFIKVIGKKFITAIIDDHLDFLEEVPNNITKIWFRNGLPISNNTEIHSVETWKNVLKILL